MCLYITEMTYAVLPLPKPQLAEHAIKVFKILWDDLTSVFMDYPYTVNTTYHVNDMLAALHRYRYASQYVVNEGLHAYRTLEEATAWANRCRYVYQDTIIVEMTIPKGSHYFLGIDGDDIVSDTMISGDMMVLMRCPHQLSVGCIDRIGV